MMWRSRHRNSADGEDVISARPFVVLADIFIMLFVLFLVMPFFMYLNAQRAIDFAAMEELRNQITSNAANVGIPYERIARDILKASLKRLALQRKMNKLGKIALASRSMPSNDVVQEKYRSGDLIRYRVQGTLLGKNPFSDNEISIDAQKSITDLAELIRPFASGNGMSVTSKFKSLDEFLQAYELSLDDFTSGTTLGPESKAILWNDHIRQADQRGVIKRITIQGHRNRDEPVDADIERAKRVAEIFQVAGGNPFEPDEVEVSIIKRPIFESGDSRHGLYYPNQYVDIVLVFNQDHAVLFKDKLQNIDK